MLFTFKISILIAIVVSLISGEANSVDLGAKIRLCSETYRLFYRPVFGEDRDYCDVFEAPDDVSDIRGIQADVITVIESVGRELANSPDVVRRSLAVDLAMCVQTFPPDGRASTKYPDWCLVTPNHITASFFRRAKSDYLGVSARYSLPDVLDATLDAVLRRR